MVYKNAGLLIILAFGYFSLMLTVLRVSKRFGIGIFITVLGVMHFLETYLASVFYIALPYGIVASPGSAILFSSKLILILLLYITEDADTARQPIYGLFIGNAIVIFFAVALGFFGTREMSPGRAPDLNLIDDMGWLMGWGTLLLFIDAILIILLYEKLRSIFRDNITARIFASSAIILTFDQLGFYSGLRILFGTSIDVLWSGWVAKMAMAAIFSPMAGLYLHSIARHPVRTSSRALGDIFSTLTYRERYEALLQNIGRDRLTGVFDRGHLETNGAGIVERTVRAGRPISLLLIDLDNFKDINDRHGHRCGDLVLRFAAQQITMQIRDIDFLFRYGGDEFLLLCPGMPQGGAENLAERIRFQLNETVIPEIGQSITVSIGTASQGANGSTLESLFEVADKQLYAAKKAGRNRVFNGDAVPVQPEAGIGSAPL